MRRLLFRIARSKIAEYFIGVAFAYCTPLMPLNAVHQTATLIVFPHPKPFWQQHFLIVPKQRIASIARITDAIAEYLVSDCIATAKLVAEEQGLLNASLLVNGGVYQDVPQLHFHLFSGADMQGSAWEFGLATNVNRQERYSAYESATAFAHPQPRRQYHFVIWGERYSDMLQLASNIVLALELSGYALVVDLDTSDCLQLISGTSV